MWRLQFSLTAAWAGAWVVGVGIVLVAAIRISSQYHERDLDAELALHAMAVYGLAWIDDSGHFHDEYFNREDLLLNSPFDIWAVEPGSPPVMHLEPKAPRFDISSLQSLAREVVDTTESQTTDGYDRSGRPYRLRAIPSYDDSDVARMAIIVVGDTVPSRHAHRTFVRKLAASSLAVAFIGIAMGAWLARRSLLPLADAYQQRERFLGGAAHELRGPVASLRAICESAACGDESAEEALARILPIVLRAGELVDDLLLYARLGSGGTALTRSELRLDLLAEACLPDEESIGFEADEHIVSGDAGLLRVAIVNLLANALNHARRHKPESKITLTVRDSRVVVEDDGPGFPEYLLADATEPFISSPESRGIGLGLALARLIAEIHDGELTLENRPQGGARVTLRLPIRRVS